MLQCASSYHHFQSIENITKVLTFFLKPGGSLLVTDIMHPDEVLAGTSSDEPKVDLIPERFHHIVSHTRGFKSEQFRQVFEDAGLVAFTFDRALTTNWQGQGITLFVAKGQKPTATL